MAQGQLETMGRGGVTLDATSNAIVALATDTVVVCVGRWPFDDDKYNLLDLQQ